MILTSFFKKYNIKLGSWPHKQYYGDDKNPSSRATYGRHAILFTIGDWQLGFSRVRWGWTGGHGHTPGSGWTYFFIKDQAIDDEITTIDEDGEETTIGRNAWSHEVKIMWAPIGLASGRVGTAKLGTRRNVKKLYGYAGTSGYDGSTSSFGLWPLRISWHTPQHDMHWTGSHETLDKYWEEYRYHRSAMQVGIRFMRYLFPIARTPPS